MSNNLKAKVRDWLSDKVDAVGFAPVDRFGDAPEKHHPDKICKDARTVVVFGKAVPQGILHSPEYNLYALHRAYHTAYMVLDDLALDLATWIESQGSHLAVPMPSYAPMVFHGMEPWGVLSLKHAAVCAGLGAFGRSGQMYSPRYGGLLRLGGVVTNADLPGDPMIEEDPCPPKCNACQKACPSDAFDDEGNFNKMTCLTHTIKHAIYPLAFRDKEGLKHIERVINTAGYNYWLNCDECLKVCPSNRPKKSSEDASH